MILRALSPLAFTLLAGFVVGACRSSKAPAPEHPGEQDLTPQSLQDLIAKGALKPVDAMNDPGDAYKNPFPQKGEDAFAKAAAKLKVAEPPVVEPGESAPRPPPGSSPPPEPTSQSPSAPSAPSAPPAPPAQSSAPVRPADSQAAAATESLENPYLIFGKRIQVYPQSGLIMKPYPLRVGTGRMVLQLMQTYGNFPLWQVGPAAQTPQEVRMELVEKWDQELFSDMRLNVPQEDKTIPVADWLIVTSGIERLKEVESFINIFAASVPQIEIEAKIVEVSLTDQLDYGVAPVDATTPIFGFPDATFVRSFNYNLPNTADAVNSFLTLGAVQDGLRFNAVLQALASYENVSIISQPKIAVREGARAQIVNTTKIPTYVVSGINATGQFAANLNFEEVGIKLYVIPRVVGTQTVALNIDMEASAETGTAVTFTVPPVGDNPGISLTNPVLSKRAAQTVVYLEPGQAVILGGLIAERTADHVRKVPLLGDIPLLGNLFKSTLKRKEQTNVLFFIRPRILQGSDLNREF